MLNDIRVHASYKRQISHKMKYVDLFNSSDTILDSLQHSKIFKYSRRLSNECAGSHYINFNIPKIVWEAFADCTVWSWYTVDIDDENISDEIRAKLNEYIQEQELDMKIYTAVVEMSYIGMSIFRHRERDDASYSTSCLPIWYYRPWYSPELGDSYRDLDSHMLISASSSINSTINTKIVFYERNDEWKRDIKVWHTDQSFGVDTGLKSDMVYEKNRIVYTKDSENKTIISTTDVLPLVFFNNHTVCNYADTGEVQYGFGESDIQSVYDLVLDINTMLTNISIEYIKNWEAIKSYPKSMVEYINKIRKEWDEKKLKQALWANVVTHDKDGVTQFVQKDMKVIESIKDQIHRHIKLISAVTWVPLEYFGVDVWWANESAQSKVERNKKFIAKCNSKRRLLTPALKKLYYIILVSLWREWDMGDIKIDRNDPFETEADANKVFSACDKWLISRETATRTLFDMTDDERALEQTRIADDQLTDIHLTGQFTNGQLWEL